MTTTTASTATAPSRTPLLAALGIAGSAVLTAIGTFGDSKGNHHTTREYVVTLGIVVVAAALAYGLGVRGVQRGNPGRRAAIFGVLALVSCVAFWAGIPMILVSATVACALADKDKAGSYGSGSKAGLALATLAGIAATVFAFAG
jgi:hypothetical protein